MGVLTVICMIFTLVASLQELPFKWKFVNVARRAVSRYALLIALVALWNFLWYAPWHFKEFWGQMAFAAGVSMLITLVPLIDFWLLPKILQTKQLYRVLTRCQWVRYDWKYTLMRLVLLDCIVQYAWTLLILN